MTTLVLSEQDYCTSEYHRIASPTRRWYIWNVYYTHESIVHDVDDPANASSVGCTILHIMGYGTGFRTNLLTQHLAFSTVVVSLVRWGTGVGKEFLGRVRLGSSIASLVGVWIFQSFLKETKISKVLFWTALVSVPLGFTQVK